MIKPTHQIAYNYTTALLQQRAAEDRVCAALQVLCPDNQVLSLAEPVETAYTNLVHELLGDELWEWLLWWIYECENGTRNMEFIVGGTSYDPTTMTLYRFLEIVNDSK